MTEDRPSKPWDGIITEEEKRIYAAAGFGRPSGMGQRPALLIIDVQYRTVGSKPAPFPALPGTRFRRDAIAWPGYCLGAGRGRRRHHPPSDYLYRTLLHGSKSRRWGQASIDQIDKPLLCSSKGL